MIFEKFQIKGIPLIFILIFGAFGLTCGIPLLMMLPIWYYLSMADQVLFLIGLSVMTGLGGYYFWMKFSLWKAKPDTQVTYDGWMILFVGLIAVVCGIWILPNTWKKVIISFGGSILVISLLLLFLTFLIGYFRKRRIEVGSVRNLLNLIKILGVVVYISVGIRFIGLSQTPFATLYISGPPQISGDDLGLLEIKTNGNITPKVKAVNHWIWGRSGLPFTLETQSIYLYQLPHDVYEIELLFSNAPLSVPVNILVNGNREEIILPGPKDGERLVHLRVLPETGFDLAVFLMGLVIFILGLILLITETISRGWLVCLAKKMKPFWEWLIYQRRFGDILETSKGIPVNQSVSMYLLMIFCALIPIWQTTFSLAASKLDDTYQMKAAGGLYEMNRFVYFYYYLDIFPLAATGHKYVFDINAAKALIRDYPDSLIMDYNYIVRAGDFGRILMFLPVAFLLGEPSNLNIVWINSVLFSLALVGLLIAAWKVEKFRLGLFLVAFLGSHPFQLFEIYITKNFTGGTVGNVFALAITINVLLTALHLPLLFGKKISKIYLWILPLVSGIILGTAFQIRTELIMSLVSVVFAYLLMSESKWRLKISLILVLLVSFSIVSQSWLTYFNNKYEQTVQLLESIGANPYKGPRHSNHTIWHTIFVGLGDFGSKYGYQAWDDTLASEYALPILKQRNPDFEQLDTSDGTYTRRLDLLPEYGEILKEKVTSDILNDPIWYLDILFKRLNVIMADVAPVRIGIGAKNITFPLNGYWIIPGLLILWYLRRWSHMRLILFSLPLAIPALVIYSGRGMTYYSTFPQILAAICCSAIILWCSSVAKLLTDRLWKFFVH